MPIIQVFGYPGAGKSHLVGLLKTATSSREYLILDTDNFNKKGGFATNFRAAMRKAKKNRKVTMFVGTATMSATSAPIIIPGALHMWLNTPWKTCLARIKKRPLDRSTEEIENDYMEWTSFHDRVRAMVPTLREYTQDEIVATATSAPFR